MHTDYEVISALMGSQRTQFTCSKQKQKQKKKPK